MNSKKKKEDTLSINLNIISSIVFIIIAVLISLYVGYKNYKQEEDNSVAQYKNGLLLFTNILTLVGAIIILYVSYLNRKEQSLTPSDVENPLI